MKSIFKRQPKKFNVGVDIHLFGEKMELSVPITTTSKGLAKKLAVDLVPKKIFVTAKDARKVRLTK